MTKDEALKMAIESLEKIASFTQSTNLLWWQIEARKPINACKEALDTEQVREDAVLAQEIVANIEYVKKQPAQEPVDWMDLHKELGFMKWIGADEGWDKAIEAVRNRLIELSKTTSTHVAIVSETYQSRHTIELNGKGLHQGTKLYTHPHQFQALTDDEIHNIADYCFPFPSEMFAEIFAFARAIEQALRIKNDYQS